MSTMGGGNNNPKKKSHKLTTATTATATASSSSSSTSATTREGRPGRKANNNHKSNHNKMDWVQHLWSLLGALMPLVVAALLYFSHLHHGQRNWWSVLTLNPGDFSTTYRWEQGMGMESSSSASAWSNSKVQNNPQKQEQRYSNQLSDPFDNNDADDLDVVPEKCRIVMAKSTLRDAGFGMFALERFEINDTIIEADPAIPVWDLLQPVYAGIAYLLHTYIWEGNAVGAHYEANVVYAIVPGVGSLPNRNSKFANVQMILPDDTMQPERGAPTRFQAPRRQVSSAAGAVTPYQGIRSIASRPIKAGQEIMLDYGPKAMKRYTSDDENDEEREPSLRLVGWLRKHGMCLDSIRAGPSSTAIAGAGAFATRELLEGSVIAPVPVIPVNRTSLVMPATYRQDHQLLLNYCYGHRDSSILLLPYAPVVTLINHDRTRYNARLQWSTKDLMLDIDEDVTSLRLQSAEEIMSRHRSGLLLELVAVRDIDPGEEILIDYGFAWHEAWTKHAQAYEQAREQGQLDSYNNFVYVAEMNRRYSQAKLRTVTEQAKKPYPSNVRTACYYNPMSSFARYGMPPTAMIRHEEADGWWTTFVNTTWAPPTDEQGVAQPMTLMPHHVGPCQIMARHHRPSQQQQPDDANGSSSYVYTVELGLRGNVSAVISTPDFAAVRHSNQKRREKHLVHQVPRGAIQFVNQPYMSDLHLPWAFRHEIGLPRGVFPTRWLDLLSSPSNLKQ